MASIFDGTQPPAWLVARQGPPGGWGEVGGTLVGGLINALEKSDKKTPVVDETTGQLTYVDSPHDNGLLGWWQTRKGVKEGLAEARLNQVDPTWRLKMEQAKLNMMNESALIQSNWLKLGEAQRDISSWMNQDLPALQKWREEIKTDPDATPPVMQSERGKAAAQNIEAYLLRRKQQEYLNEYRKETNRIRNEQGKLAVEGYKDANAWRKAYGQLSPEVQAKINGLEGRGIERDAWNNPRPTEEAISIANEFFKSQNMAPYGTAATVESAIIREQGAEKRNEAAIQGRKDIEASREGAAMERLGVVEEGKKERQKTAIEGRVRLEELKGDVRKNYLETMYALRGVEDKLKSDLAIEQKREGKQLTREEFISRNLKGAADELIKTGEETSAQRANGRATAMLNFLWDATEGIKKKREAASPKAPSAAPGAAAAPGGGKVLKYDPSSDTLK